MCNQERNDAKPTNTNMQQLGTYFSDPNMLTSTARPRYPSFVMQDDSTPFGGSVALVRHTEDGLLSAKYRWAVNLC